MNNLLKNTLLLSCFLVQIPLNAYSADNYLNITFKNGSSEKYVRLINLLTSTNISQKITDNTYKIKVKDDVKSYQTFFSTIPEVEKIIFSNSLNDKKSGDIIQGHILVRYKNNVSKESIQKIDRKLNTKSQLISSELNLYKVVLPANLKIETAIKQFVDTKMIEYAEPDRVMKIQGGGFGIKSVPGKKKILISFKKESEGLVSGLFNIIYNQGIVKEKNNWYSLDVPGSIEDNLLLKSFKISPYIENVKLFSGNNNE